MVKDRIIVALDVERAADASRLVEQLRDEAGAFKIGLQLYTAEGPGIVRELVRSGLRVFLDLKFHDIPNTVARASVEAARLGLWMFNVHAAGGSEMMRRTLSEVVSACDKEGLELPRIIAVTVLTSSSAATLAETGVDRDPTSQVLNLAGLTAECGLHGVVASPLEIVPVRERCGRDFLIVTPGIRPVAGDRHIVGTSDDQKRVMSPAEAVASGADYLVIGRPVTGAPDPVVALRGIVTQIEGNR